MIYYRIDYDFLITNTGLLQVQVYYKYRFITSTGLLQIQDMILELKRTGEFIQLNVPDRSPYLNCFTQDMHKIYKKDFRNYWI
jgi:hypothetical protein